jgi:glycosyltransferase involved in cell wall biosynthesis
VGVPVRNEAANISCLLNSLLEQTVKPEKILVCVNGSTDDTYDIASRYAQENSIIQVIRSSPGKANAWHAIIEEAPNDLILFCDGDVNVDKAAAEILLKCIEADPELILAGGTAWSINEKKTFFSKYFIAAEPEPPEPKWVIGRLYMIRLKKLKARVEELNIELMPRNIINDDGYLELVTSGNNVLTKEAFVTSAGVDSFSDWRNRYVRILAGQLEIERSFPQLLLPDNASPQTAKEKEKSKAKGGRIGRICRDLCSTYRDTKHIESLTERAGIMFIAIVKIFINFYYKVVGGPYVKNTWVEAHSTKKKME